MKFEILLFHRKNHQFIIIMKYQKMKKVNKILNLIIHIFFYLMMVLITDMTSEIIEQDLSLKFHNIVMQMVFKIYEFIF